MIHEYDVVVVGGGIAGLYTALTAAEYCKVAVVSKVHVTRSHSVAAQGGIAASLGNEEEDHWEWHMYDTVKGSDYLADQDAVEILTKEAPEAIISLEHMGVPFTRNVEGKIEQRRFGGHTRNYGQASVKRACYVSDRTGRAIMDTLYDRCQTIGVDFFNEVFVLNLLFAGEHCCGVSGYDVATCKSEVFHAKAVVLASGGSGKIFKTTSNGFASTADGFALVLDSLIPLEDMEFVQFHPTGIYGFGILISEAARAEGGVLRNGIGERFMERYAPNLKDLAPRDIISRAILTEIKEGKGVNGKDYVSLDLTKIGKEKLIEKLPEISSFVQTYLGIDPSEMLVPVAPTCHYIMGGIPTDYEGRVLSDEGEHALAGLFAVGECACVSVHGANRLGCNSLIDLVVFGRRTGISAANHAKERKLPPLPQQAESIVVEKVTNLLSAKGKERAAVLRAEMQSVMTEKCSVFRNANELEQAQNQICQLENRLLNIGLDNKGKIFNYELQEALELSNMLKTAGVIVFSALQRKESRGAHYRNDYQDRNDEEGLRHSLVYLTPEGFKITYKPVSITRFTPENRRY
ncbi:MAG TPA: succinate dehydrogenase flavoprotein subunit [Candidatus Acidoferrum sp.]|nr:succinate dehydrogenase flavoprotein subunit [Candidatus Acidoferrum sp.]